MSPLVLAACLALLAGPAVHALLPRAHAWESALDGFALAVVLALCLLHLLPEALEVGGVLALVAAVVGFLLLTGVERMGSEGSTSTLLVVGLALHAMVEGVALGSLSGPQGNDLGLAVVAHRLPVGLLAFLAIERARGWKWALVGVGGLAAATVAGASVPLPHELVHGPAAGLLSAFVAGTLLHVVLDHGLVWGGGHDGHDHGCAADDCCDEEGEEKASGCGTAACCEGGGGGRPEERERDHEREVEVDHDHDHGHDREVEVEVDHDHDHDHGHGHGSDHEHGGGHDHAHPMAPDVRAAAIGAVVGALAVAPLLVDGGGHAEHGGFLDTLRDLTLQSAPALLIGYVLAGLLTGLLGDKASAWIGRGGPRSQSLRGMAFGLPIPVCSCGVLPMYEALVRRGVPAAAAMTFLVATPELGLDAVLLSLPLLGVEMTVARVIGAAAVALAAGLLVGARLPSLASLRLVDESTDEPIRSRVVNGVRYGLVDLFDHTVPWVVVGLLVAALAEPLLSHPVLQAVPGWLQVPLFAAVGVPVYVCASGATPLAAVAVYAGVGPGAAIAFLLAGPATNITTFGILGKLHGKATALRFGLTVGGGAVLVGWLVDAAGVSVPGALADGHEHDPSTLAIAATAAFLSLLVASLFRQGPRGMLLQVVDPMEQR